MDKVAQCIGLLSELFEALREKNYEKAEQIAEQISIYEHQADILKNDIRNHLPKSLFLPLDRANLLEILSIQDHIADHAEDVAVLTTLKPLVLLDGFKEEFALFLTKNLEAFNEAQHIIHEMHDLLESSFGGAEAHRVRSMTDNVAYKEHEVDLLQRKLLKALFQSEEELSCSTLTLWQRIFEALCAISNLSENLANRVRLTLELK
jgi:predicted phosphate transport protein (TIGR00153 family)